MIASALVLSLVLAGSPDELSAAEVETIRLMAPAAWNRTAEEGTTRFADPSGEAYFQVNVGEVQREGGMPAKECLGKIIASLGAEDFVELTVGGAPAAFKVDVDVDAENKAFHTYTFVGCDGRTTWALSFHLVGEKKARFAPLAKKVGRSVTFAKGAK